MTSPICRRHSKRSLTRFRSRTRGRPLHQHPNPRRDHHRLRRRVDQDPLTHTLGEVRDKLVALAGELQSETLGVIAPGQGRWTGLARRGGSPCLPLPAAAARAARARAMALCVFKIALDLQLDRSKLRLDDDARVTNTLPWVN